MFALLLLSAVSAMDFNAWTAKYQKSYSPVEALRRRAIFNMNARFVRAFNEHNTFELSVEGPFAAMSNAEYQKLLVKKYVESVGIEETGAKKGFPTSLDLRTSGKVTPVRDQAQCGSCYSFGSLASLEGRLLMIKGSASTLDLAEEQIVRCSDNNGCNGGTGSVVYDYIKANGIVQEKDYPYTATDGSCTVDTSKKYATITGYKKVTKKDNNALKTALVDGVVDVSIDASSVALQLYKTGVYHDTKCKTGLLDLNHEVASVGYGALNGEEYWIVKNSWGTSWGDKGYVLMAMAGNTCGITTDPIYPTGVKYL